MTDQYHQHGHEPAIDDEPADPPEGGDAPGEDMGPEQPTTPPPVPGKLLDVVEDLIRTVEQARTVPLSGNVMLPRDEFLRRMHSVRDALPEELRAARWMVREREAFVARTNERARELMDKARERSREMVSDSHIVKEAVEEANQLVRNAESQARRIRLGAEDYAEERFAEAETVLAELIQQIRAVRAELHQSRPAPPEPPISE